MAQLFSDLQCLCGNRQHDVRGCSQTLLGTQDGVHSALEHGSRRYSHPGPGEGHHHELQHAS